MLNAPATRSTPPTQLIQTGEALGACLNAIAAYPTLAFDLEFDSHRNAYGVTLCLIQVATPEACYVIDPLADIELGGLWAVFEDERVQKIVHSPGEDLRLLHALSCFPKNLFDTEVVAKLLNYGQTSLAAMLEARLGYTLDKGQQRSNWLRRPLSEAQIIYAADDVAGLHRLKEILAAEAEARGLMDYVAEEQEALSTTIHQPERKDFFLKPGDVANLSPYNQYVLNELFRHRDELARGLNRPAFQVMDEATVRGLANGEVLPQEAPFQKGIYGGYKNAHFGQQLAERLQSIHATAAEGGLSKSRPQRVAGGDGRTLRAEQAAQHEAVFKPIQIALAARYGEHAARFMLSNGAVADILKGNTTIGGMKRKYRGALIRSIALESGIDISMYL